MSNGKEWNGVYYPNGYIENQDFGIYAALFFDKIICNLPISDMSCGGGSGLSDFFEDDPLVISGIVEMKEELIIHDINTDLNNNEYWGTHEEFEEFLSLQVTAMAIRDSSKMGYVPFTDNVDWPIPASLMQNKTFIKAAKIQATTIGITSLELTLPEMPELSVNNVLELRRDLIPEMSDFRNGMMLLSPMLNKSLHENATIQDIYSESKYIVETKINPTYEILKNRIQEEEMTAKNKLIKKCISITPKIVLNWTEKSLIHSVINSIKDIEEISTTIFGENNRLNMMTNHGIYGYLLSLSRQSEKKRNDEKKSNGSDFTLRLITDH